MVTMQKGFQSILFGDIGTRGMFAFMVRGPRGLIYAMEPESFGANIRAMKYP